VSRARAASRAMKWLEKRARDEASGEMTEETEMIGDRASRTGGTE